MNVNKKKVILITSVSLILLLAVGGYIFLKKRGETIARDMQRLKDMKIVQGNFERLYYEKQSFADAAVGCPTIGTVVQQCDFSEVATEVASLRDPSGLQYVVVTVPNETEYAIQFTLEKGNSILPAGEHTLTQNGIK